MTNAIENSSEHRSGTVLTVNGRDKAPKWLAFGGIAGALAASTCCILPLALTVLGVSGAWLGNLRALAPYQPYFVSLAVASIGYGFYRVYRKPKCVEGMACARPIGGNIVKVGLWSGTVLVLVKITFSYWFFLLLPYLP